MADRFHSVWTTTMLAGTISLATAGIAQSHAPSADDELGREPSWQSVSSDTVFAQLDAYLRSSDIDAERKQDARLLWWDLTTTEDADSDLLDRLVICLARTDDRAASLHQACSSAVRTFARPDVAWLADSRTHPFVRHNLRLYYARWLAQNEYHGEALEWTDGLSPDDVVAPAALLFYRAVAEHQLVRPDRTDALVAELLQRPTELPIRYQKLASLMQKDVAGLEDESLDHIARRMADIQRRLALGRAGKDVQDVEQGVIDSLDKLIKRLEELAQQQQAQSGSAGGPPSGSPMQDSQLAELKGPGRVDSRNIGRGADWGDLPDKEREQALQEIGRDFPSHYREVIEEYFRQLAAEPSDDLP